MTGRRNSQTKSDPDKALVEAIQAGGRDLFPELVERYQRALYSFGFRMCGDPADAEDLVQDTFLNVFRYLNSFRRETKFKNWLYRIAASVCIKKRRKSKFAPERELSLDQFLPSDEAGVELDTPRWADAPLEQVLNEELERKLQQGILELPEKYRSVLVLRDIEGFSTEETVQILDLTASNVKVRLHRARLYLRDHLKDYFRDD
jgi:RNA polymerase sigma-70 factor (ECF subfamily)